VDGEKWKVNVHALINVDLDVAVVGLTCNLVREHNVLSESICGHGK
jgi:hypothetical protein